MKIAKLFLSILAVSCAAIGILQARPFGGGSPSGAIPPYNIGGVSVGTQGNSGVYTGYTMVGGDNFTGPLSIVHITDPFARYWTTRMGVVGSAGARLNGSATGNGYNIDPYHTGDQDSNRGVAVGSTNMSQGISGLVLKSRIANGGETPYIDTDQVVSADIFGVSYLTFSAPAVYEVYANFTPSGFPTGWHPTTWLQNVDPANLGTAAPGWLEYDDPEVGECNFNAHGSVVGPGGVAGPGCGSFDSSFHLYTLVLTASGSDYYTDGVKQLTVAQDATNTLKPYQPIFTGTVSAPNITQWTSAGTTGATLTVAWYRVWIPNAQASNVINPTQNLPTLQANFNTNFTYTFPSATTLWGSNISDYLQALRYEDFEPGCAHTGCASYQQFPSSLTYNNTTRVLSGKFTDRPGRLHLIAVPYKSGGALGYTAKGYIDIGPTVTSTSISYSNGTGTFDLYFIGDCGTLVPKTMSVTGLPSGLSFSPTTFRITGTATTGTYTINMSVTNSSGQNVSSNITLTVGS